MIQGANLWARVSCYLSSWFCFRLFHLALSSQRRCYPYIAEQELGRGLGHDFLPWHTYKSLRSWRLHLLRWILSKVFPCICGILENRAIPKLLSSPEQKKIIISLSPVCRGFFCVWDTWFLQRSWCYLLSRWSLTENMTSIKKQTFLHLSNCKAWGKTERNARLQ